MKHKKYLFWVVRWSRDWDRSYPDYEKEIFPGDAEYYVGDAAQHEYDNRGGWEWMSDGESFYVLAMPVGEEGPPEAFRVTAEASISFYVREVKG